MVTVQDRNSFTLNNGKRLVNKIVLSDNAYAGSAE
jgi:hypothetical protein